MTDKINWRISVPLLIFLVTMIFMTGGTYVRLCQAESRLENKVAPRVRAIELHNKELDGRFHYISKELDEIKSIVKDLAKEIRTK